MSINPIHSSAINKAASIQKAYGLNNAAKPSAASGAKPAAKADRLELGTVDRLMTQLKANDVRWDKVNLIKGQIDAGTYETDDKLDAASDKLLDELA